MDAHATAVDGNPHRHNGHPSNLHARRSLRSTKTTSTASTTTRLTTGLFLFFVWAGMMNTTSAFPGLKKRAAPALAADQIIALDLIPSATGGGQLEVILGADSARQTVRLLPTFRKKTEAVVQVPGVQLCAELPKERPWNAIRIPRSKEVVMVNSGTARTSATKQVVRWAPSPRERDVRLRLILQKGSNVTILEGGTFSRFVCHSANRFRVN